MFSAQQIEKEKDFSFHTGSVTVAIFSSLSLESIFGISVVDVSDDAADPSVCWFFSAISFLPSSLSKYFCQFSKRSFLSASDSSILGVKIKAIRLINSNDTGGGCRSSISIYLYLLFPSHVSAVSFRWPKNLPFIKVINRSASSASAIVICAIPSGWRCEMKVDLK